MVDEMINGIDMQVAKLNLAWNVKFFVFMVLEELVKPTTHITFELAINDRDTF